MNHLQARLNELWETLTDFGKWQLLFRAAWLWVVYPKVPLLPAPARIPVKAALAPLYRRQPRRVWIMEPDLFDRRQVHVIGTPKSRASDWFVEEGD